MAFTPDEEIGRGTDHFDLKAFGADFAYTVDGGKLGELEYENFNAAGAVLTVFGVNTHPGDAKNKMRNAAFSTASSSTPCCRPLKHPRTPRATRAFTICSISKGARKKPSCTTSSATTTKTKFEARKAYLRRAADYLNEKYGAGTFDLELKDSYYNMKEIIEQHMDVVEAGQHAMRECGVEPKVRRRSAAARTARCSRGRVFPAPTCRRAATITTAGSSLRRFRKWTKWPKCSLRSSKNSEARKEAATLESQTGISLPRHEAGVSRLYGRLEPECGGNHPVWVPASGSEL